MGTITASILVGTSHPNDGGIIPTHQILLSENSRPSWTLTRIDTGAKLATWIPTVENMLEDALLMVGLFIVKDEQLRALDSVGRLNLRNIEMYKAFSEEERQQLYLLCRSVGANTKVVLTVMRDSTVTGQVDVIKEYSVRAEVCMPVFCRDESVWVAMARGRV